MWQMPLWSWPWLTLLAYALARSLHRRQRRFWLSPIVLVPLLLFALAIPSHTHYADYAHDTGWLVSLLGPATVAFAVPIWTQRALLARHWLALGAGMLAGSAMALFSSWQLAHALALDGQVARSLLPRSITTPFAMEVSRDLGGAPELTAAFVMVTGIVGMLAGHLLLRLLPLKTALARGAMLGVAAHGAGAAKAHELGGPEGTVAGLLMVLTGIFNLLLAPLLLKLL